MTWLRVLDFTPPPKPEPIKRVLKPAVRSVTIKGVRYRSLLEARKKLGLRSYSQVYRLIGESWRYGCRKR